MTAIRFHIGAHKTATTHLQMTLSRAAFRPGTRYVPLKRLRLTLISAVRKGGARLPWHRWHKGTWLFSDENILGTTENALRMYQNPAHALRYFLDCELSVFLCVRCYDTFLASAYGERLWRHPYRPFAEQLPMRRWPDVVRDLQRDLPGVPIHIWRYEDYRENAREIAQYYAGGAISAFGTSLEKDPKSGFSTRAVAEMARFSDARPRKTQVLQLRDQYPISAEYPRFNPWTAEQQARLREMYGADLVALNDRVQFWRPGHAHSPKR